MAVPLQMFGVAQETKVSVNILRAIVETAEREGIPRKLLLSTAQREPSWIEAPNGQVPCSELYQLCEVAMELSDDDTLALHLGAGLKDQALNVVSHLVKYAATLRHALDGLFRFSRLLSDQGGSRLVEQGDWVTIQYLRPSDASPQLQRFFAEFTLAGLHRLIRFYSPSGRIERVSFEYGAPSYHQAYTETFEGAERFDQPFTGIVFDSALMNATSPYKDEDLHSVLRALAERRLMQVTHCTPYSVRAHEVLMRQRAPQRVPMEHVARELDISVRSLRRRLAEEGKSYRGIANDACTAVATRLIANERRTIQETAYAMGFSDANSFHRAFKRWTGTTPSEFRDHSYSSTRSLKNAAANSIAAAGLSSPPPTPLSSAATESINNNLATGSFAS